MAPPAGAPAVRVDEDLTPVSKNSHGAAKLVAEDLCSLFCRQHGMSYIVLRTSRFFRARDDSPGARWRERSA